MIVSPVFLSILVGLSLLACAVSPVVLIVLFLRELKKESLW